MSTVNIKLDFLVCETSINTFLCKFYYYDNVNSRIMPWTAQQSTKQDALALMQTYSNDLYTSLLNIEGITPLGGGSVTDYGTYSEMSFDIVVEAGSQSQDIDYTQILTSINSNLAIIAGKNNQSDIVNCLNRIFCYIRPNGQIFSCVKNNRLNQSSASDDEISYSTIYGKLNSILQMFYNIQVPATTDVNRNNSIVSDISKKLSFSVPLNDNSISNGSIKKCLQGIYSLLTNNSTDNNSCIKDISEKLANANDLHTISQAIDLISTAIVQTPTTDVSGLTSAVQNLKLESNNLIQVEGDIDYRIKYDKDKE